MSNSIANSQARRIPTRLPLLVAVMAGISLGSVAIAVRVLYADALETTLQRLEAQLHAQNHFIEAALNTTDESEVLGILKAYDGMVDRNDSGEVLIARRENDKIVVLFQYGHRGEPAPASIPFNVRLPIGRALSGESGTVIAKDLRGKPVVAAFSPVAGSNWGLVVKVDLAEVRAPFVRSGVIAGSIAFALVLIGAFLFIRINYPVVAELARSERRYRSLIQATNKIVWSADAKGFGEVPNSDWQAFTGQAPYEAAGYGWLNAIHPDDREQLRSTYKKAISEKQSYQMEVRVRRHDGVYRTMLDRGVPVMDDDSNVLEWVGTSTDITDQKAAAAEHARLTTAIEQSSESVMITDVKGQIQYVNPAFCAVTGYSSDELLGQTPKVLNSGHHSRDFFRNLWETLLSGRTWRAEVTNRRKDGSIYTESTVITPVRDDRGEIVNFIATRQDVTERHNLEDRLRQAQKMEAIGRLAGGVAHDFNNILNVILGYTELVTTTNHLDPTSRERLSEVLKAANRAAGLTRQLLAFSRKQVLQPCVLNLNSLLTDLNGMLRRVIGEDVELIHSYAPMLGNVFADPGQMEQVVVNLVVNSRDAMPRGGTLTIQTADVELPEPLVMPRHIIPAGRYVTFSVSDTGCGIPLEAQAHVFEPFYTTKQLGTGLGLATVYGIVKQSGGHISLRSDVGQGASFLIYLPRVEKPVEQLVSDPIPTAALSGHETILIVEDAASLRRMAREVLAPAGYTILEAENGSHALDVASRHNAPIDLLITDVVMPMLGGAELAESLLAARPEMKVIYMSGYTDDQTFAIHEGQSFLQKPFSPAELLHQVRKTLDLAVGGQPAKQEAPAYSA